LSAETLHLQAPGIMSFQFGKVQAMPCLLESDGRTKVPIKSGQFLAEAPTAYPEEWKLIGIYGKR